MYKILMSEGEHAFTGVATSPRHYKRGMACVKNRDMMWATLYNGLLLLSHEHWPCA